MNTNREFRQVRFGRNLEVKRLRAVLSQTMREMTKDPAPEATPVRLESILIETGETTVRISGNGPGLDAVTWALGRKNALRLPRNLASRKGK